MSENVPDCDGPDAAGPGARLRVLRTALKLTQEAVADRSGGRLQRTYVVNIEAGRNKASTDHVRAGFAAAFGLTRDQLAEYLEGSASLEQTLLVARVAGGEQSDPTTPPAAS